MNRIRLPRDGAEYAHFTFTGLPDDVTLEAQIGAGAWTALDTEGPVPRLLLRGPDAPAGSPGVLVAADATIRVRVLDSPETIVRGAGYVVLTR